MQSLTEFLTAKDLSFSGIIHDVKKSNTSLSPIFEAFTNALEAIKLKRLSDDNFKGNISIDLFMEDLIDDTFEFKSIKITDNGVGFNNKEFVRFNTFKDNSKGYKNLGSGRLQYLHYFNKTTVLSTFEQDGKFIEREFEVSKSKPFLDRNAIVKHNYLKESNETNTKTVVHFTGLLDSYNFYNILDDSNLKHELLKRYLHYFCFNATNIPAIKIHYFASGKLKSSSEIKASDIPKFDRKENLVVHYSKMDDNAQNIVKSDKVENFEVTTFKIPKSLLDGNDLKLISKGELVEETKITLKGISKSDSIGGNKYLILVSGNYIDEKDSNVRGKLNIPARSASNIFTTFDPEIIFLDDIEDTVNDKLIKMYPEIEKIIEKHNENLKEIKEMFLISDDEDVEISLTDDSKKILEKFYEGQARKEAKLDITLKKTIEKLNHLDPTLPNYHDEFESEIQKIVKILPEQNKRTLSHYVARRKLVLELLSKINARKLQVQINTVRNKDEALIHQLLFQKKSENSFDSNLWILNEDFIYFEGKSEFMLKDLTIDGKMVFKSEFEEEESKYLMSLGQKRLEKRPDVLLFPEEGKCVIIEFKAPSINASEHLTQINTYASLIRNYTNENFEIKTFYGYLIGEGIEPNDVMGSVGTFEHSYNFDYLYSPAQKVHGFNGKDNGSIYTEVLKYSSLLKRATLRNKIFIDKLGLKNFDAPTEELPS